MIIKNKRNKTYGVIIGFFFATIKMIIQTNIYQCTQLRNPVSEHGMNPVVYSISVCLHTCHIL